MTPEAGVSAAVPVDAASTEGALPSPGFGCEFEGRVGGFETAAMVALLDESLSPCICTVLRPFPWNVSEIWLGPA